MNPLHHNAHKKTFRNLVLLRTKSLEKHYTYVWANGTHIRSCLKAKCNPNHCIYLNPRKHFLPKAALCVCMYGVPGLLFPPELRGEWGGGPSAGAWSYCISTERLELWLESTPLLLLLLLLHWPGLTEWKPRKKRTPGLLWLGLTEAKDGKLFSLSLSNFINGYSRSVYVYRSITYVYH